MDDDIEGAGEEANRLFDPVSSADFAAVDINALTADIRRVDRRALLEAFEREARRAEGEGGATAARVFHFLHMTMGFHLRVEPEGDPFGLQWDNGVRRTALPSDLAGEQSRILAEVASKMAHPALRARLADIAYENGERRAGRVAVEAYCEVARWIADGRADLEFEEIPTRSMDLVKPIERCFMINARIAKRGTLVEPLAETLAIAFDHARCEREYFPFAELGQRMLQGKVRPAEEIARIAEELASAAAKDDYVLAVKEVWGLAATAHRWAGDENASREASIRAVEMTVAMAETVGQSAAKAHWVKEGIREFRALGGCQDRVAALRARLRQLQESALDEYGAFQTSLDGIGELREKTFEQFAAFDLPIALRRILEFLVPENIEELKASILDQARKFPLSNLFSSSYSDDEGREVARGAAMDIDAAPTEDWFKEQSSRHLAIPRRYVVHGNIEPARYAVLERFSINQQHMIAIVRLSPFVPAGHHAIFAMGFARLWQGDYVTAGHLLIPQIENSLRYILKTSGRDASKIEEDGIEGDRPLNILLSHCRADLEAILGADMVWHLDILLNFRPGPALRHGLAHGKMGWGSFHSDEAMLACWTVYLLTAIPVLHLWDSHVAPALAAMTSSAEI